MSLWDERRLRGGDETRRLLSEEVISSKDWGEVCSEQKAELDSEK